MSDHAQSFVSYLAGLKENDRGAFAHLRRSLGFDPGAYPPSYPYVERFIGPDTHAEDPRRRALYLAAGLFALHPAHQAGVSVATALGKVARARESASMEQRFIALLGAEADSLPNLLRQSASLLAADGQPYDYVGLIDDLARWFEPWNSEARDRLRQRWARDFYRAYAPYQASDVDASAQTEAIQSL